jgi:hypothetical protein
MVTGKKPASKAGKELADKKSTKDEKTVAGSDLAQHPVAREDLHTLRCGKLSRIELEMPGELLVQPN